MKKESQKKIKRSEGEIRIAHRLAAQATIAWHFGSSLKVIRLTPGLVSLEETLLNPVPDWANLASESVDELAAQHWRFRSVMTLYAGEIAAAVPFKQAPVLCGVEDKAFSFANQVCSSAKCARLWLKWVYAEAEAFLQGEWPKHTVPGIAQELLAGRAVNYETFEHITHTRPISDVFLREVQLEPLYPGCTTKFVSTRTN